MEHIQENLRKISIALSKATPISLMDTKLSFHLQVPLVEAKG
jgi:hypothetical protein